ncbi:MAG: 3'-5' exonuclease [Lachnospiraceae bacterium]
MEAVLALYHFSMGQPWPLEWLQECREMYVGGGAALAKTDSAEQKKEEPDNGSRLEEDSAKEGEEQNNQTERVCGKTCDGLHDPLWLRAAVDDTKHVLEEAGNLVQRAYDTAMEPFGPAAYGPALLDDLEQIERVARAQDYHGLAAAFRGMHPYKRLSTKKDPDVLEEKKQLVKDLREAAKTALAGVRTRYFYDTPDVIRDEFERSGLSVLWLTYLTEAFSKRLAQRKAEKNMLDFSDLEHLALQILVERKDGENHPSAAAREYAGQFEEIMIDEYQDSNLVQELILGSVSGGGCGAHNLFMVGDVKQSIYRFRLARPELFLEKYHAYPQLETAQRIDLHKNFRSRYEVLNSVNYIFRQIMTENPGGIVYDEDAALYAGAKFPERVDLCAEKDAWVQDGGKPESDASQSMKKEEANGALLKAEEINETSSRESAYTTELWLTESDTARRRETEARMVGARIEAMVGKEQIWDKDLTPEGWMEGMERGSYRPVQYKDVVILLRTVSGWADTFGSVLTEMGIPNFTGSQSGYFSAAEVRTVLSYLQVLDNPRQDIPLAAVLHSAIGGLDEEELAWIRSESEEGSFYECCRSYLESGADKAIKEKLAHFFDMLERFRARAEYTPVHLLLWEILDETGYGAYAQALPAGSQRKANLDMLVEKAIAYEATSYRGLYHFVRYIENLKKYEVDYGEANIGSESDNTVRIMSIHKSKGLEFPVVFVCGMAKQFNETDSRAKAVMHPSLGIGCDCVDTRLRTRQASLLKKIIQKTTSMENLGEEMRVLYVAMTRAKEKLILTGCVGNMEEQAAKWSQTAATPGETLPYSSLTGASSYLDWVMPALMRHPDARMLALSLHIPYEEFDQSVWKKRMEKEKLVEKTDAFSTHYEFYAMAKELFEAEEFRQADKEQAALAALLNPDLSVCVDEEARKYLAHVFSEDFAYQYERGQKIAGKLSVSELKKRSQEPEETDAKQLYAPEEEEIIPGFYRTDVQVKGAARGTLYHTFMENLDFSKKAELQMQLEELVNCGKMSRDEASAVRLSDIRRFLKTKTGKGMEQAARAGKLHREQPFVLGVPAETIQKEWSGDETVLVQGIIDAWFEDEDGAVILVDYKTDHIADREKLAERYRGQLSYYAQALEQLTGRTVKTQVIYSFFLGKEIVLSGTEGV